MSPVRAAQRTASRGVGGSLRSVEGDYHVAADVLRTARSSGHGPGAPSAPTRAPAHPRPARGAPSAVAQPGPAVIPWEHLREWLVDGDTRLLVPAPEDVLVATPASKRVNTAGNEGPGCWEDDGARDDERLREALALFPRAKRSA